MIYNLLKVLLMTVIFLLVTNIYYLYVCRMESRPHSVIKFSHSFYNKTDKAHLIYTPGCRILKLDPFDFTVKKFYSRTPDVYDCGPNKPIFYVKKYGVVSVEEAELYEQHSIYLNETNCFFNPIIRESSYIKPDGSFLLGDEQPMIFDLPMDVDFILLSCKVGNLTLVKDILALTPMKQMLEVKYNSYTKRSTPKELNVVIVGIDSVSKLNFLRYFNRTLNLLQNDLSAIELHGYTKVGDNTYPNLIAFLTGHDRNLYKALEERFGFYDDVDFIWKRYSESGYTTLFSEDSPAMGTFILNRRGFRFPPTDYYTLPFAMAVDKLKMRRKIHCIGAQLEMRVYFDYLKNFISTMENKPFFTLTFMGSMTHDILQNAGYVDTPSYELINDLKELGVLNNSLFVFFSDHGLRFGDIRRTYIGKIEERMPFIFLVFPKWFSEKYPHFSRNLEINKYRLTTPYDVHATFLHILDLSTDTFSTVYGQSLLNEISPERTCSSANIAKHWCVCETHQAVSTEDGTVRKAARAIIGHLNKLLRPFKKVCAFLTVGKILDARVSKQSEIFQETNFKYYLVTVLAFPSSAVFEATIQVDSRGQFGVSDEVSRINRYNNESFCVNSPSVKKYCYCKEHFRYTG